jgi:2-dehydro-3-deoxyphosphogluconate aldolase/(4S)-4-hydroxy-2-oxoglutarate aldolase
MTASSAMASTVNAMGPRERLRRARIVPVIVIDDASDAVALGDALLAGGMSCVEITFRTDAALAALRRLAAELPKLLIGAGTVLTPEKAKAAKAAGAQFIVAPGFNPRVVDYCLEQSIPMYPGVATPSDIEAALERGLSLVKFFPAEPMGGRKYLEAVAAPYKGIDFIPTGGINADNVNDYLAFNRVVACGGSWMAPASWIAAKQFDRIRQASAEAMAKVAKAGSPT